MTMLAPWLETIAARLAPRMADDTLPHAFLIKGPAGLGKRTLSEYLARALLCTQPGTQGACGRCRACTLLEAGSHPDRVDITLAETREGRLRSEIVVDQIRALSARLAMSTQLGGRQVACIDPADALNRAAANALLKTLEEPTAATVMLLVADEPWRLPATILSRCQHLVVREPPREQAMAWLNEAEVAEPEALLEAAGGNPGLARKFSDQGVLERQHDVRQTLAAISDGREDAYAAALRWSEDEPSQRLWLAAQQLAARARECHGDPDRLETCCMDFARFNRARESLRAPLRVQPNLVELFLSMGQAKDRA